MSVVYRIEVKDRGLTASPRYIIRLHDEKGQVIQHDYAFAKKEATRKMLAMIETMQTRTEEDR